MDGEDMPGEPHARQGDDDVLTRTTFQPGPPRIPVPPSVRGQLPTGHPSGHPLAGGKGQAETSRPERTTVDRASGERTTGDLVRTGVRGLGQLLVTAGLIVLLFVVYEVWVTDLFSNHKQDQLSTQLREDWTAGDPTVPTLPGSGLSDIPLGQGFAFVRIPRFGPDYVKVILQGTEESELVEGPGHYVDSAMPGEQGNFALAGHRVGKGSPFLDLDQLGSGDPIVIETATTWFVYRVVGADDPNGVPVRSRSSARRTSR